MKTKLFLYIKMVLNFVFFDKTQKSLFYILCNEKVILCNEKKILKKTAIMEIPLYIDIVFISKTLVIFIKVLHII